MILDGPDYLAPAKLNLFLHVVGQRADGYHFLQTAFRLLDLGDVLRFRVRRDGVINRVNSLDGVPSELDLTVRAARALQSATGVTLGADIELEKYLPMGGGVGGGSSDAATTLLALNHLWETGLSRRKLMEIGLGLGADVPVFIYGRSSFAEGVGERLQAIELPPAWYVVLTPSVAISTREIFTDPELTRDTKPIKLAAFSAGQEAFVNERNDLEPIALKRYPEVALHLEWLRQFGPARMTGSGSSVFCAFATKASAHQAFDQLPSGMRGFIAAGCDRHPLFGLVES
ncbi:MAG TPA: 4-(cytidine 5'-diphospho)-2-C-methyl-D-erythritol kinase [Burkholderiales bacterium]|nr:4-(cytidine 5'-diphospho)-2-C-methyl-D-erythritol kinase [Burkholderiales bacterium]